MSDSIPYADILILALIAGFIALRLRNVLGQKPDNNPNFSQTQQPGVLPKPEDPIVQLGDKLKQKLKEDVPEDAVLVSITDEGLRADLLAIKAADAGFSAEHFVDGAKAAFDMVFYAFVKGDKHTLANLLSPELYKHFEAEITRREQQENRSESTLVSVDESAITKASLVKNNIRIAMRFVSEQVTVMRNKENKIIEGDPSYVERVEDEWVFERELAAKNPNWKIMET